MSCTDESDFRIPDIIRSAEVERNLLDSLIENNPLVDVRILLNIENHLPSSLTTKQRSKRFQLDLRSLRDDLHRRNETSDWEAFLDAIFPTPESSEQIAGNPRINKLKNFEVSLNLCMRDILNLLSDSVNDSRQFWPYLDLSSFAPWRLK